MAAQGRSSESMNAESPAQGSYPIAMPTRYTPVSGPSPPSVRLNPCRQYLLPFTSVRMARAAPTELGICVKKRLLMLAVVPIAVVPIAVLTLWGMSDAATTDTAAATVDPPVALVGAPITFTSTNPCTTACSLTWRRPDIGLTRFGGVIVGRGDQFTMSFPDPGTYEVVLDMGETCDGTTRLVCHSYALVFVDVVTVLPTGATPPADAVPPDPAVPPGDVARPI